MILRIIILALGTFVWQVTEILPIGLLGNIARGLHVSDSSIGLLVTGYAWLVALTAIPLTMLASGINRRALASFLMALVGCLDLLSAIVPSYLDMIVLRILLALGHGVFWSIISDLAVRLAPDLPVARVTAWVFTGIAIAFAGGIPLANAIGQWMGWRAAFGLCGALGLIVAAATFLLIPSLPNERSHKNIRHLLKQPVFRYIAFLTALTVTAHFCGYTYIEPLLRKIAHIAETQLPLQLLVFGVAGIVGNWLGGRLPLSSARKIEVSLLGVLLSYGLLILSGAQPILSWIDMALWGMVASLLNIGVQSYALELAPDQRASASSFCVTGFNIGIGAGAFCGGLVLPATGPSGIVFCGAALSLLAFLFVTWASRRKETKPGHS